MPKLLFYLAKFKNIIIERGYRDLIARFFKQNYKVIGFFGFFIFLVIWFGQMIAVVGSKQIIEPIAIVARDQSGQDLPSFKRFMQLARSGNFILVKSANSNREVAVDGVFVKKIMLGFSPTDLASLGSLEITIGERKFDFSGEESIMSWAVFDKSLIKPDLHDVDYDNYLVVEVPPAISLSKSRIPLHGAFFSSLINWSGDDKFFIDPLKNSFGLMLLILVILLLSLAVFLNRENKDVPGGIVEEESLSVKREFVIFFLTILSTIAVLSLLVYLIGVLYRPDVGKILKEASETYVDYFFKLFIPKPVERLQFILSAVASPFILGLFYYWFNKKFFKTAPTINNYYKWASLFGGLMVFTVVYLGLAMSNFFYIKDSYYFGQIGRYLYSIIFFPIILSVFLIRENLPRLFRGILYFIAGMIMVVVFFMNVMNLSGDFQGLTFDPIFYPVTQVAVGKSMLVNLSSLYGLYPFFMAQIFKVIELNVLNFSILMAILIGASLFLLWQFMARVIDNKWLLLSGYLSLIFYSLLATRNIPEHYFQYWPIRFLFPCLGLFLMAVYLKTENKILYYLSFLAYSAGIFWNFDAGIMVFISWLIVLSYNEFSKNNPYLIVAAKIAKHLAVGALSFFLFVGYFAIYTYLISGQLPNFSLFTQYQKIFLSGYLMIKMLPPPHAWNIVVLIYLSGLLVSIVAFLNKRIGYTEKIILLLSVLGVGLFFYYEGQSSDVTLFRTSYPALILAVIFADGLWKKIKKHGGRIYGEKIIFSLFFYVILSAPFNIVYNSQKYLQFTKSGISAIASKDSDYFENIDFIRKFTQPGEDVFILSAYNQAIYYGGSHTRSVVDVPSVPDIALPKEINTVIDFLKNNRDVKIFAQLPLEDYNVFDARIKEVLTEGYVESEKSGRGLSLYRAK